MSKPVEASSWFFGTADKKKVKVSFSELHDLFQKGKITVTTLVWRKGQGDWSRIAQLPQLHQKLTAKASNLPPCAVSGCFNVVANKKQSYCADHAQYAAPAPAAPEAKAKQNGPIMGQVGDWKETFDANSGHTYWYNTKTSETSWTKPNIPHAAGNNTPMGGSADASLGGVGNEAEASREDWIPLMDPATHRQFYYNTKTAETAWDLPDDYYGDEDYEYGQGGAGEWEGQNAWGGDERFAAGQENPQSVAAEATGKGRTHSGGKSLLTQGRPKTRSNAAAPFKKDDAPAILDDEERKKLLHKAASELVSTEKTYVKGLKVICKDYIRRLKMRAAHKQTPMVMTAAEVSTIFGNVEAILNMNREFYREIKELFYKDVDKMIAELGRIFDHYIPFFRFYTEYVANYQTGLQKMRDLMKERPALRNWLEFQEKCQDKPMNIESYLIMPVQRVPRYVLLLKEISKHSERLNLPHVGGINKALKTAQGSATAINTTVANWAARAKVIEIQTRLGRTLGDRKLVAPGRYLVKHGPLDKILDDDASVKSKKKKGPNVGGMGENKTKPYMFFLFNDVLIYASGDGDNFSLKAWLPLEDTDVQDLPAKFVKNGFQVMPGKRSSNMHQGVLGRGQLKEFIVVGKNVDEKRQWFNAVRKCIDIERKAKNSLQLPEPKFVPEQEKKVLDMVDALKDSGLF